MRSRGLLHWFIMLLWIVATHHCVFEQIAFQFHQKPTSETTQSGSDSSSDCPAHPVGDPAAHSEGRSCGTIIQASSTIQIRDASKALIPVLDVIVKLVFNSHSPLQIHTASLHSSNYEDSANLKQLTYSLSIAPNAPPVTLA